MKATTVTAKPKAATAATKAATAPTKAATAPTKAATALQTTNNEATSSTAAKAGSPDIYGESPSPPPVPKKRARTRGGLTAGRGRGLQNLNDKGNRGRPKCKRGGVVQEEGQERDETLQLRPIRTIMILILMKIMQKILTKRHSFGIIFQDSDESFHLLATVGSMSFLMILLVHWSL